MTSFPGETTMFSRRSSWDLRVNRLTAALEQRRARGRPMIDLTLSNPTRAGFAYPEEIGQILARAGASTYRPEPLGLAEARQAVAGYYADRGLSLGTDRILLTASTSEAYGFLFKLLADPGDEILVPRPSYPLFEFLAELEGVATRSYPLRYGPAGWETDVDRLAAAITERCRAIVLVHPNNPTGSFVGRDEADAISALAGECGLALIVDEVFGDYAIAPAAARIDSFAAGTGVLTFALSGLSKVMGLPQLKLSWIAVQGPDADRADALARLELIADTYLSVATPIQEALPELMGLRDRVQDQIRARIRGNLQLLEEMTAGTEKARLLRCYGGWYAVLEVDGDEEELSLALLLRDDVLAHPGFFYDFARDSYIVLSLLSPEFAEGVERLLRRVEG